MSTSASFPARHRRRFRAELLSWFDGHRRPMPWRNTSDPWAIWVSEVMLQQTRVEAVVPYFERFMAAFNDVQALADADLDQVLKCWEGLGYYARARNLHRAARQVVGAHGGRVPDDPAAFLALPGVGPYIAAAVQSIAFGRPLAAVDGNVKRVLARLCCMDTPINGPTAHTVFAPVAQVLLDPVRCGDHNQAMMELGATVCTPAGPNCAVCPVSAFCAAHGQGREDQFPVRNKKPPVPIRHVAVAVISRGGKYLICKRRAEGLLGGLWEFPGGGVEAGESATAACVREVHEEVNLQVAVTSFLTRVTHTYTHFQVEMDVFLCTVLSGRIKLNGPVDFAWVKPAELQRYAFPGANRKFIPLLVSGITRNHR